jgi:hypothetical protein
MICYLDTDIGGDEDEGEGRAGTARKLINLVGETVGNRRTGRARTATAAQILSESAAARAARRLRDRLRARRNRG